MRLPLRTPIVTAVLMAGIILAWESTPADAAAIESSKSSNWAGYAVNTSDGSTSFASASGSWVQPTADCSSGSPGYAAFWVGLGGFADASQALEQIGTEADCSASGGAVYSAWYELVPASSVRLKLTILP